MEHTLSFLINSAILCKLSMNVNRYKKLIKNNFLSQRFSNTSIIRLTNTMVSLIDTNSVIWILLSHSNSRWHSAIADANADVNLAFADAKVLTVLKTNFFGRRKKIWIRKAVAMKKPEFLLKRGYLTKLVWPIHDFWACQKIQSFTGKFDKMAVSVDSAQ